MNRSIFSLEASLAITKNGELFLSSSQIRLLRQILVDGSIHAAAISLKMSYQHAWHLMDRLNKLSPIPLIIRQKGGKDGGGCSISPYGIKLMDMFLKKETELLRFIEQNSSEFDRCFF